MNEAKVLVPQLISPKGAWFFWKQNAENIFNNLTFKNKKKLFKYTKWHNTEL